MDIYPPIEDRTTEELLEIIETQKRWRKEVLVMAQNELSNRGIPFKEQSKRRTNRNNRETNFKRRIKVIKERASYLPIEKALIFLFGPFLIILFKDLLMFHSGEGYKQKNQQGALYLVLGIGFWISIIYLTSRY